MVDTNLNCSFKIWNNDLVCFFFPCCTSFFEHSSFQWNLEMFASWSNCIIRNRKNANWFLHIKFIPYIYPHQTIYYKFQLCKIKYYNALNFMIEWQSVKFKLILAKPALYSLLTKLWLLWDWGEGLRFIFPFLRILLPLNFFYLSMRHLR